MHSRRACRKSPLPTDKGESRPQKRSTGRYLKNGGYLKNVGYLKNGGYLNNVGDAIYSPAARRLVCVGAAGAS